MEMARARIVQLSKAEQGCNQAPSAGGLYYSRGFQYLTFLVGVMRWGAI